MTAWLIVLVILLPWCGALAVWLAGDRRSGWQHGLATASAVATAAASIGLLSRAGPEVVVRLPIGGAFGDLTFVPDGLGVFLAAVASVVGSLAVVYSIDYMRGEAQLGRYYALVLMFIGAMAGLVLCGSLLFVFFFWEITAFCSYALISFHNDDPAAVSGGIKALVMTQLGGIGLLAGALLAYAALGDYQISTLLARAGELPAGLRAGVAFGFLAAAAAKSAQVPFHTWLPDAMEAPTPVTALIHAATMVNAGVYLLARFYPAFESVPGWSLGVVLVGLLSALLAGWMALVETDLKRALAYSTVSQLGVMVYAIGCGGIFASQFHLLSHSLFKALLFLGAGAVIHAVATRDLRQMGGLGRSMPFVRNAFVVGFLGLAALPLANGFWSKELILEQGAFHGPAWANLGMLLGGGLTALYGVRLVSLTFAGEPRGNLGHDASPAMRLTLGVLAVGTLTSWLVAGPFSGLLATTLPWHHLESLGTFALVIEILTAMATWIALGFVTFGIGLWLARRSLANLTARLHWLAGFGRDGLGFEWINLQAIQLTSSAAVQLRRTQTGQLAWNVAGILVGLLVVLVTFVVGA